MRIPQWLERWLAMRDVDGPPTEEMNILKTQPPTMRIGPTIRAPEDFDGWPLPPYHWPSAYPPDDAA